MNTRRQQQKCEQLLDSLQIPKKSWNQVFSTAFEPSIQYVDHQFSHQRTQTFSDFRHALSCISITCICRVNEEDNTRKVVNSIPFIPITHDMVKYEQYQSTSTASLSDLISNKSKFPICFVWNTDLEFSMITNPVAQQMGFKRYDDETVFTVEVNHCVVNCVIRFIEYCLSSEYEDGGIVRWYKLPVLWSIFSGELSVCYFGRRGSFPAQFVHVVPGRVVRPVCEPVIPNLLSYMKEDIITKVTKVMYNQETHELVEDEYFVRVRASTAFVDSDLSMFSLFQNLPIVFGTKEVERNVIRIEPCDQEMQTEFSEVGLAGWDFLKHYGSLMYQGYILCDMNYINMNIEEENSIAKYNGEINKVVRSIQLDPVTNIRMLYNLYYQLGNGVSFRDYLLTNKQTAITHPHSENIRWKSYVCILEPSKERGVGNELHQMLSSREQLTSATVCLDYESRISWAYLSDSCLSILNLQYGEQVRVCCTLYRVQHSSQLQFPKLELFVTRSAFPLIVLSVKQLLANMFNYVVSEHSNIQQIKIIVENEHHRSVYKAPCQHSQNTGQEVTTLIVPEKLGHLLNIRATKEQQIYVQFKKDKVFRSLQVRVESSDNLYLTTE